MQKIKIIILLALLGSIGAMVANHLRNEKDEVVATPTEVVQPLPQVRVHPAKAPEARSNHNIPEWILRLPHAEQEQACLTLNIYHEARGEPDEGMRMIGYVTEERKKLKRSYWGSTVCEVVFKKRTYKKKRNKKLVTVSVCEFSWACMSKIKPHPRSFIKITKARQIAREQLQGKYAPPTHLASALYYLRPEHSSRNGRNFFKKLVPLGPVGHHKFYTELGHPKFYAERRA